MKTTNFTINCRENLFKFTFQYTTIPTVEAIENITKVALKPITLQPICSILETDCHEGLSSYHFNSQITKSFEALNQNSGFVIYETKLPPSDRDPSLLDIETLRDRAHVYVNKKFFGILSRESSVSSLPIRLGTGNFLQILVENQGRSSNVMEDNFKGILSNVKYGETILQNWRMIGLPFDNYDKIEKFIGKYKNRKKMSLEKSPTLLHAEFTLGENDIGDTYLNPTGWGKVCLYFQLKVLI